MPLAGPDRPILLEHLSSPPVFSGVRVTQSLVLCVCFVDLCLSFCSFSFDHCVVCSSSIYGLPIWYLQILGMSSQESASALVILHEELKLDCFILTHLFKSVFRIQIILTRTLE